MKKFWNWLGLPGQVIAVIMAVLAMMFIIPAIMNMGTLGWYVGVFLILVVLYLAGRFIGNKIAQIDLP